MRNQNNTKENWVRTMVTKFWAEEQANPTTVGGVAVGNKVSISYLDVDRPRIGVAKCNPTDEYDLNTGIAIAYARANGIIVPDYVLENGIPFDEINVGTVFYEKGKKYIKTSDNEALCYADYKIYTSDGTERVTLVD